MIEKKLEKYQFYNLKKFYPRSIWSFYQAFGLSLAVLDLLGVKHGYTRKDIKERENLYKRILLGGRINQENFNKATQMINKDIKIITTAIEQLEGVNTMERFHTEYETDDYIAILGVELEYR